MHEPGTNRGAAAARRLSGWFRVTAAARRSSGLSRVTAVARRSSGRFGVTVPPRGALPLCLLLMIPAAAVGCGVLSPEEQLLTDFFEAARLHDTTAAAKFSAVTLNPRVDGVVDRFDVEDVAESGDAKRVTIRALVRRLEGAAAEKTLVVTLARKADRWFITGISGP